MRKRQMKQERKTRRNLPYAALTLAALMTICHASAVFAGSWQKDEKGWRFQHEFKKHQTAASSVSTT